MKETITSAPTSTSAPVVKRKKSRRRLYWILGGVAALILAAVVLKPKGVPPTTVAVEKSVKRDLTQLVSANGKVQPEVEVKISPEVAGEITELPVKVGQAVKKGDLLMKIKPDTYVAQVDQKEAMIRSSRALNSQQEATMKKTKEDLGRARTLFSQKITSEADILAAETAYSVSKAVYEASLSDIKRAESDLTQVKDLLEKTVIISPIDGVISVLNSQQGERVVATGQFAGTEVMRVADFNVMEIRVQVNENDIPMVKMGDPVAVTIDAFAGRPFRGKVSQIANSATTTGAGTQEEVTNFEVRVRVDAQGAALRPGMSGTADVETQTVKGAIAVPIQSVSTRERGYEGFPGGARQGEGQGRRAERQLHRALQRSPAGRHKEGGAREEHPRGLRQEGRQGRACARSKPASPTIRTWRSRRASIPTRTSSSAPTARSAAR